MYKNIQIHPLTKIVKRTPTQPRVLDSLEACHHIWLLLDSVSSIAFPITHISPPLLIPALLYIIPATVGAVDEAKVT
jgi:hypothetical protein